MNPPRVSPDEAKKLMNGDPPALLVCAYEDEQKCRKMRIPGATTRKQLADQASELDRGRHLIFY